MEIVMRNIEDLKPFAKNPKKHPEKQIEMLKKSMGEFGFTNPILVSNEDMIIAGHGRMEAAKAIGLTEVPTINIDLPYEKAVAYVIADNRLAELAEEDSAMLADLLNDIDDELMEAVGFSQDDLDELLDGIESEIPAEVIEDEAPEVSQGEPVTQRGDVWVLGKHRLCCGDSTDTADVSKLMEGDKADMVFTDPPYNVNFTGALSCTSSSGKLVKMSDGYTNPSSTHDSIHNDKMSKEDFKKFMDSVLLRISENCNGGYYICFSSATLDELLTALNNHGMGWKSIIVWNKNQSPMGGGHYRKKYEPIAYGYFENKFYGEEYAEDDVWDFQRTLKNDLHPTMKPVPLVANAIQNSSKSNQSVLDLFGGSGSTMMACEQTGRINYSMELDEKYCDVIIQRYVNLTGDDELTRNGEPYLWRGSDE